MESERTNSFKLQHCVISLVVIMCWLFLVCGGFFKIVTTCSIWTLRTIDNLQERYKHLHCKVCLVRKQDIGKVKELNIQNIVFAACCNVRLR